MAFSVVGIILAGLLGTLAMTSTMYLAHAFGVSRLIPGFYLGTFLFGIHRSAYATGLVLHFLIGVVIAGIYAAVMSLLGIPGGIGWGLLFGAVHWLVAMVFYGFIGPWHPAVRRHELDAPGFFARHEGWTESMGSLVDHLLYGAIGGGILGTFQARTAMSTPYSFDSWQQPLVASSVAWLVVVLGLVVAFIVFATLTTKFRPSEVFVSGLELDEDWAVLTEESETSESPMVQLDSVDTNRPENTY